MSKYDHKILYETDPEYKALVDFMEHEHMVDWYDYRLDRWSPIKYIGINGPLTIAEVFTKIIVSDNEAEMFVLNLNHPHCEGDHNG